MVINIPEAGGAARLKFVNSQGRPPPSGAIEVDGPLGPLTRQTRFGALLTDAAGEVDVDGGTVGPLGIRLRGELPWRIINIEPPTSEPPESQGIKIND